MKNLIIILIILVGLTFGALNYHFILLDDSLKVLKKTELTLDDTFVDARGVKKLKLLLNPSLIEAGLREILKEESGTIRK